MRPSVDLFKPAARPTVRPPTATYGRRYGPPYVPLLTTAPYMTRLSPHVALLLPPCLLAAPPSHVLSTWPYLVLALVRSLIALFPSPSSVLHPPFAAPPLHASFSTPFLSTRLLSTRMFFSCIFRIF